MIFGNLVHMTHSNVAPWVLSITAGRNIISSVVDITISLEKCQKSRFSFHFSWWLHPNFKNHCGSKQNRSMWPMGCCLLTISEQSFGLLKFLKLSQV